MALVLIMRPGSMPEAVDVELNNSVLQSLVDGEPFTMALTSTCAAITSERATSGRCKECVRIRGEAFYGNVVIVGTNSVGEYISLSDSDLTFFRDVLIRARCI